MVWGQLTGTVLQLLQNCERRVSLVMAEFIRSGENTDTAYSSDIQPEYSYTSLNTSDVTRVTS